MSANREYKSSVFATLFSDVEKLLSLYNALSGSRFPMDAAVEIATLEDVLFHDRLNDIAFVVEGKLVILIEHQSTVNENMPLRLLLYLARIYEKLIANDTLYLRKRLKIPRPDFIVLYNGTESFPDEKTLRLSDAFEEYPEELADLGSSLELQVRVVNVNEGRNMNMVGKCEDLRGYVRFVEKVRVHHEECQDLEKAVTRAVKECIQEGILVDFLTSHSSEVINMLTAEFDLVRAKTVWVREAREEGREEGMEKGLDISAEIVNALINKEPAEEIAVRLKAPLKTVEQLRSVLAAHTT